MGASLGVQLYSLNGQPADDPAAVVERLARLGYLGVEAPVLTGMPSAALEAARAQGGEGMRPIDLAALKRALTEHGMVAPSSHVQLPEGEHAEQILDEQEALGAEVLIVAALIDLDNGSVDAFDDLDRIKLVAERFNRAAERARARGMRVGYHNHFWEFGADFDGRSGLEVFFDLVEPDVVAEVDAYWAQVGGRDPAQLITALGDRVWAVHVKDGDGVLGTPNCALGSGVVDLPAVLAAATAAEWHVVELEGLTDDEVWPLVEDAATYLAAAGRTTLRQS